MQYLFQAHTLLKKKLLIFYYYKMLTDHSNLRLTQICFWTIVIKETQGTNSNVSMITKKCKRPCSFACWRLASHQMLIPLTLFFSGIFFFWCSCVSICIIVFLSVNSWMSWLQSWNHTYWSYFIKCGFESVTYFNNGSGEVMSFPSRLASWWQKF